MSPSIVLDRLADVIEKHLDTISERYPASVADAARVALREVRDAIREIATEVSQSEWEERMGDDL